MSLDEFLVEDYRLKTQYLADHFSRMWMRFNFFLTINAALFGFSFDEAYQENVSLIALAGVMLSPMWFYFGAADNHLADIYRGQLKVTFEQVWCNMKGKQTMPNTYSHVGDTKQPPERMRCLSFRMSGFSATELAVAFPVVFLVLWAIRLGVALSAQAG